MFSELYILPPTPRLLSHIDDVTQQSSSSSSFEDRLAAAADSSGYFSSSSTPIKANSQYEKIDMYTSLTQTSSSLDLEKVVVSSFGCDLSESHLSASSQSMMEVVDVVGCEADRICDFARFADSAKSLEERFAAELQSFDDHFDLSKFERNNNQSCGRAFHDIQTFHSLVPGLET